jgi:tetratricopeptide (TPR) repeat protein
MPFSLYLLALAPQVMAQAPAAKKPIAAVIEKTILNEGIEAGVKQYKTLKQSKPDAYDFSEKQLEGLGTKALDSGMVSVAIQVFELNAGTYPQSAAAHSRLGLVYLRNGDNAKALGSYQKVLSLNPKDAQAKERIGLINNPAVAFVCPPCKCSRHKHDFKLVGKCPNCRMGLVEKSAAVSQRTK